MVRIIVRLMRAPACMIDMSLDCVQARSFLWSKPTRRLQSLGRWQKKGRCSWKDEARSDKVPFMAEVSFSDTDQTTLHVNSMPVHVQDTQQLNAASDEH